MEIISNIALISINETLIVQLISFLVFLFLINRIMFRPLGSVMLQRSEYMESLKQGVVEAESEVVRLTEELGEKEAAAKQEAFEQKKELELFGAGQADEIYASVRNEIVQLKNQAEHDVEIQINRARESLHAESKAIAEGIMEKVLNRRVFT
ncbi:MAG: ATP synthase F0 subunit B [Desulfobacterales bacterium]